MLERMWFWVKGMVRCIYVHERGVWDGNMSDRSGLLEIIGCAL
jgi:hypothetical protein